MSNHVPRYSVGTEIPENGWPVLMHASNMVRIVRRYRTELAAQEVADVLNKWAGQEKG